LPHALLFTVTPALCKLVPLEGVSSYTSA